MKDMKGWIFSRLKNNREKGMKYEPIEFVSCPYNGSKCTHERSMINKCLSNSYDFFADRQYDDSIDELKRAFDATVDIEGSPCSQCAQLFRARITESMEKVHGELHRMTTGFFRWDELKPSYEFADSMIQDFRQMQ